MLRSNSAKALSNIRKWILENTDTEGYDFSEVKDFKQACEFIMTCFYNEKVLYDKRKMSFQELFIEWLQGLPDAIDSASYIYHCNARNILADMLEETETEKNSFTERQAEDKISYLIFREVFKACEYKVKSFSVKECE